MSPAQNEGKRADYVDQKGGRCDVDQKEGVDVDQKERRKEGVGIDQKEGRKMLLLIR